MQWPRQCTADVQFTWAKCMDASSEPYSEQFYAYSIGLNYGRCDYNVGKGFTLFGVCQPVVFLGSNGWIEKIAGVWTLSGIFNIHSRLPWSPMVNVNGGNTYCANCGYGSLFPTAYLGGAGTSTSNSSFMTVANSNFPKGGAAYFSPTTYAGFMGTALPPSPGVARNSLNLPGYKDVDLTLAKAFGLPKARVLAENARIEFRVDAYNLFNNLNLDPTHLPHTIVPPPFTPLTAALPPRY